MNVPLSFSFFSTLTSCWLIKVHPLTTHFHDEKNKIKFRTRKWAEGKIGGDSRVDIQHKTTDKHQRLSTLFPRDLHFHLNSFSSSCFYIEMFIKKNLRNTNGKCRDRIFFAIFQRLMENWIWQKIVKYVHLETIINPHFLHSLTRQLRKTSLYLLWHKSFSCDILLNLNSETLSHS